MTDLSFRQAVKADLPSIRFIERYCFWPDLYRSARYLNNLVRSGLFYVAEVDGVLAGYISLTIHRRYLEIRDLAVLMGFRRTGIATEFLNIVFFMARILRLPRVQLTVDVSNAPACALYRKFGFEEKMLRRSYYGRSDGVLMSVHISD